MFHVVLFQPEIPPNTGNIIRLCANTGTHLHLIEPLAFALDEKRVVRAGLDYREMAIVRTWPDWPSFRAHHAGMRLWAFSTRGGRPYAQATFRDSDALLFGPETRGLPQALLTEAGTKQVLRLPMRDGSRSLNLSNTVAVALYEALRQTNFTNLS